jgi:hypothetical protein
MPKYQCPECEAVLRRAEAIPQGKKIRCPKCEAVFPARALPDDETAKEPAAEGYALAGQGKAAPKPVVEDDEENSNPYAVIKESGDEVKPEIHLGSLRDKFAKSKIGPAMFRTVIPSNWLLRLGLFSCLWAVYLFVVGIFPLIFCEANPIRPFIRPRVDIMAGATLQFAFGAIMCIGAARMHDLTSYTWSIIGAVMALLIYVPRAIIIAIAMLIMFGPLGLLVAALVSALGCVGLWCLIILMNKEVREGFKERAEEIEY